MKQSELLNQLERLNAIGVALSAEPNNERLLETILLGAKELTNADGGTLYIVSDDQRLKFEIMRTHSLNIALGGTTGKKIPLMEKDLKFLQNSTIPKRKTRGKC